MTFSPNKTPIEAIRKGAFGGTYFRDIYSGIILVFKFLRQKFMERICSVKKYCS